MDGEIDVAELAALLDRGERIRIVDIRDERAFDRGHVPGSESIPFPELTTRVAELDGAERIVTVCPHGIASRQAAELVGSYAGTADARVESLRGGIEAWEREVGRLEATEPADAVGNEPHGSRGGGDSSRDDDPRGGDDRSGAGDPGRDDGPDAPF